MAYVVSIGGEVDPEPLMPATVACYRVALQHAIRLAKWLQSNKVDAPVLIRDPEGNVDSWTTFALISISYFAEELDA